MTIKLNNEKNGYRDYDILRCGKIKRCCIHFNPKKGDVFNIYMKGGRKIGGIWIGDIFSSILAAILYN